MSDWIRFQIDPHPAVATQSTSLIFAPATPEAAGAWLTALIEQGVLQPIGGWILLKQVSP